MGISYRLDHQLGAIVEHWQGVIDLAVVRGHWLRLFHDPDAFVFDKTIVYAAEAIPSISTMEFKALIEEEVNPSRRWVGHWTAICIGTEAQRPFALAYYMHTGLGEVSSIFLEEESALQWLGSIDKAGPPEWHALP